MALFVAYAAGLAVLLLWPRPYSPSSDVRAAASQPAIRYILGIAERIRGMYGINLVPFASMRVYFRNAGSPQFRVNIIGNVATFAPIGFFPPLLWKNRQKLLAAVAHALALPVLIEFIQLFNGRTVDIDDIMLNFIGSLAGFMIYCIFKRLSPAVGAVASARREQQRHERPT